MPPHLRVIVILIILIAPIRAFTGQEPYEQEFTITAYYSPLPGQCCYVKGGLRADKVLNGNGIAGADGTAVYPGMIAAPSSYAFGTKVQLPGIGTFTVHDRGGAINELPNGAHRLDIWVGHGEAGLARALELGMITVKGTVYPRGSNQPATSFDLATFDVPLDKLQRFQLAGTNLLDVSPKLQDFSYSTVMLQEHLQKLGYFDHAITGKFGEVTQDALRRFIADFKVEQSDQKLTEKTAAHLVAAVRRKDASNPLETITEVQRILRFLGYYKGRTDGVHSDDLANALFAFQKEYWLVGSWTDPGAGQIGPITLKHLRAKWDRTLVAAHAEKLLLLQDVKENLNSRSVAMFLYEGNRGPQVKLLQTMLAERGLFPIEKINGNFGPLTAQAVLAFQLSRDIIANAHVKGAGVVGPQTLSALRMEEMKELYRLVRSEGIQKL